MVIQRKMRIDKYLKLTRLIKRRNAAKELLDKGIFKVNDKVAKSSTQIDVGDKIFLQLGKRIVLIEVLKICDFCKKEDAQSLYKILDEKIVDDKA